MMAILYVYNLSEGASVKDACLYMLLTIGHDPHITHGGYA